MRQLSLDGTITITEPSNVILYGLTIEVAANFNQYADFVSYIQTELFDSPSGISGQFRVMPRLGIKHASLSYLELTKTVYDSGIDLNTALTHTDGTTSIDLLFGQYDYEDGELEELRFISSELADITSRGLITNWEQFSINPPA